MVSEGEAPEQHFNLLDGLAKCRRNGEDGALLLLACLLLQLQSADERGHL